MEQGADEKKTFIARVTNTPEITVAGMKTSSDLSRAIVDCSMLWVAGFMPRMSEVATSGYGESYGVYLFNKEDRRAFDYLAALPINDEAVIPSGMEKVIIPAGEYLECPVASLEDMPTALEFIANEWLPAHKDYYIKEHPLYYEKYPADYQERGHFHIYCPLSKRA